MGGLGEEFGIWGGLRPVDRLALRAVVESVGLGRFWPHGLSRMDVAALLSMIDPPEDDGQLELPGFDDIPAVVGPPPVRDHDDEPEAGPGWIDVPLF